MYDNIKKNETKIQIIIYFLEDIYLIDDILNILINLLQTSNSNSSIIDSIINSINKIKIDSKKYIFDLIIEFLNVNRQFETKIKEIYNKANQYQTASICILQWFQTELNKKNNNSKLLFQDLLLYLINKEDLLKIKIVKSGIKEKIFNNLFTIFTNCSVKSFKQSISSVFSFGRLGKGGKTQKNKIKNIMNRTYKNHIQK